MAELENIIGATQSEFELNGTNYIDIFPVIIADSARPTSPQAGDVVIQGKTLRMNLWSELDFLTYKWELSHEYKSGEDVQLHARVHPTTDLVGIIEYEFDFIIGVINATTGVVTTKSGATVTMSGTFTAGDHTAGNGLYLSVWIDADTLNLASGEMLMGNITRKDNTYNDDVGVAEIGLHIPVGKTGDKFN